MRLNDRADETRYIDPVTEQERSSRFWLRQIGGHNAWRDSNGQLRTCLLYTSCEEDAALYAEFIATKERLKRGRLILKINQVWSRVYPAYILSLIHI